MSTIRVICPTCNAELEIDEKHAGQEVECGSCLQVFVAEAPGGKKKPYRMNRSGEDDEAGDRAPRRRSRRDDDDDDYEDDRPRRRRRRDYGAPAKSRVAYILLGLFFGGLGIHNFYAGRTNPGLAQVGLNLFNITMFVLTPCTNFVTFFIGLIGAAALSLWIIVEVIVVAEDADGRRMV
ncbi:MAG: hypothetical protein JWO38_2807 [Gemmataceae bacterium]|nr:hypothetical protein [Gemmataceae bacterium]